MERNNKDTYYLSQGEKGGLGKMWFSAWYKQIILEFKVVNKYILPPIR
jgi:hypothetical protein